MKKIFSLLLLLFLLFQLKAQTTEIPVQGVPREVSSFSSTAKNNYTPQRITLSDTKFTMDNIVNWIGKGSKRAALVVQWNDSKQPDAMVWGFRWDGEATGADMIKAITKADPRFFILIKEDSVSGTIIGGIGYDLNQKNRIRVFLSKYELKNSERIFTTNTYDFDGATSNDDQNHWCSGWRKTLWSYNVREGYSENFTMSNTSATERVLQDGSWDGWCFSKVNHSQPLFLDKFTASSTIDYTKGVFFVNEGRYNHENGTLNYLNPNGEFSYDVYRKENIAGKKFGVTSVFGTIFDGKLFVISKENRRIVVADAKTLKQLAMYYTITSPHGRTADGRAFLGITPELGYISTSNGICTFNLKDYSIGEYIPGTDGETGNMIRTKKYIFAVQSKRVLILKDNAVVSTISGCSYSSICQSKDGMVWIAAGKTLIKVNPNTLEIDKFMLPARAAITDSWAAWNAGSFCASTQRNALYWIKSDMFGVGTDVYCYDIDNPLSLMIPIYSLPKGQMFYGAGIRLHPVTDLLYITTTNDSFTDFDQNWVHVVNAATGAKIDEHELLSYYWFPAMPIFPEVAAPSKAQFSLDIVNQTTKTNYPDVKHKRAYRSGDRLLNIPVGAVVEAYNMSGALSFKAKADYSEFKIPQKGFLIFNIISEDGVQVIR